LGTSTLTFLTGAAQIRIPLCLTVASIITGTP
jgi:hypothetical protein